MIKDTDISHSAHPLYQAFKALYSLSFPVFEQRTEQQQEAAFARPGYHLKGYEEEGTFVGFISYWEFAGYLYVEHFAIRTDIRGKGYGSRLLRDFVRLAGKTVLLEIDPVADPVSEARLRFYKRCGFHENPYPHTHPAYRDGYPPHPLVVLTSGRTIPEEKYRTFRDNLYTVVMDFSTASRKEAADNSSH